MLDSQVFHCYEAYEPASSSLAKPYSAIWPEMPSPAAVEEFHIKTVIERHHLYQIHGKRKSSMELCCCFFHIQMSSLLSKMQPRREWATSSFWPELLLSRSQSGSWSWGCWVSDELHHASQQAGEWVGWNYQLRASRSTNETALELEDAAKLSDTNKVAKPGNQQCNNLNHTLTNKRQPYQDTGWHSLVGPLMMVVQLMLVQIGSNWPQFVQKALAAGHLLSPIAGIGQLRGIHFILLLSTPPLPSLVTSPYPSQHIAWLPEQTALASVSLFFCPLLHCLYHWYPPGESSTAFWTLLSLWQHCEDRHKCLLEQVCFGVLVCCHVGTPKQARNFSYRAVTIWTLYGGLMSSLPSNILLEGWSAKVCPEQHQFHRLVVHSSTAFASDLLLPFSTHSSASWENT